jgi:hypothetical protein
VPAKLQFPLKVGSAHPRHGDVEDQAFGLADAIGREELFRRREATDETQGFMKVLVGANDDRILGFTMHGAEAGEVVAVIQTAMLAGLPYPKLRDAVISHLTTAEGLGLLLGNVPPRARPQIATGVAFTGEEKMHHA